jgi:tRNA modification GTPase
MLDDTIAAIATALGEGGLAVIRVSGRAALEVGDRCFAPAGRTAVKPSQAASHTIHFGHIVSAGRKLDEVLVSVMRAPRTFTREDVVEITCHGGLLPAQMVLNAVLASGARLAEPGEFTRRAFLNGRIDLVQAEAVADLIHSRTELALQAAGEQLAGKLSQRIEEVRSDLMKALAHVEAHIDFPDEDISPDTREALLGRLDAAVRFMARLLATANEGQILRRGIRCAIVGKPNAGKSSLLNCLLGRDRAIVSPVAGTTRDTIEETANVRGLPVIFVDTAGLREARDAIESEGIRRSRQSLEAAEFVLHVIDLSDQAGEPVTPFAGKKQIVVLNKADLVADGAGRAKAGAAESASSARVEVSCLTGQGMEKLKDLIRDLIWGGEIKAEMLQVMINSRHQEALTRAREATLRAREALGAGLGLELAAMELRSATTAIGEIVGRTATEDLLDLIFSQFCIGK